MEATSDGLVNIVLVEHFGYYCGEQTIKLVGAGMLHPTNRATAAAWWIVIGGAWRRLSSWTGPIGWSSVPHRAAVIMAWTWTRPCHLIRALGCRTTSLVPDGIEHIKIKTKLPVKARPGELNGTALVLFWAVFVPTSRHSNTCRV
jgi:hypothetical protein